MHSRFNYKTGWLGVNNVGTCDMEMGLASAEFHGRPVVIEMKWAVNFQKADFQIAEIRSRFSLNWYSTSEINQSLRNPGPATLSRCWNSMTPIVLAIRFLGYLLLTHIQMIQDGFVCVPDSMTLKLRYTTPEAVVCPWNAHENSTSCFENDWPQKVPPRKIEKYTVLQLLFYLFFFPWLFWIPESQHIAIMAVFFPRRKWFSSMCAEHQVLGPSISSAWVSAPGGTAGHRRAPQISGGSLGDVYSGNLT